MNTLYRIFTIFIVTLKRLAAQRGMVLAALMGVIAAVSLAMSIPMYADAAYQTILNKNLWKSSAAVTKYDIRSPFTFMYRYIGSKNGSVPPLTVQGFKTIDPYLSGTVSQEIGLPAQKFARYLETSNFRLYPGNNTDYENVGALDWVSFAALSGAENNINILEGKMPPAASSDPAEPVDVLVYETFATRLGLQVGETYMMYNELGDQKLKTPVKIPVRITGIWKEKDPEEDIWFYAPQSFEKKFLVDENSILTRVAPILEDQIDVALWFWVADGSHILSSQVPNLINRIYATQQRAASLVPETHLDVSPQEILVRYQRSAEALTLYLYAFSVPLFLMILIFIVLVMDMMIDQRKNEIAVMRSRGATIFQLIGMSLMESLVMGMIGLAVSVFFSQMIVSFFTRTVSFLNFTNQSDVHAVITWLAVRIGLAAIAFITFAQAFPTLVASRHTVITYKQERARDLKSPWWQRIWLDILLLLPTAYGFYQMQKQGSLVLPGANGALPQDPFQNPLLLLVPTLGIFAITLLVLRILPLIMALVAWIASLTGSVSILMAARYLSRSSKGYNAPLILLIMTLSLSTFTATLAQTLDRHVHDQSYYQVGTDLSVMELGVLGGDQPNAGPLQNSANPNQNSTDSNFWVFLPVMDHLKVPGVAAAARVERTIITVRSPGVPGDVDFIGLDRVDFTKVAFWRRDFSSRSLGALMNDLSVTSEGVLVSQDLMSAQGLHLGDQIQATYKTDQSQMITFKIVGTFKYFPTWYPGDRPLIVGNLDYFFEQIGGEEPYLVWLKANPKAQSADILKGVKELYHSVMYSQNSAEILGNELQRPERQGFFGLLSVGFVALALLTVLGFLLYAIFSFRRRFVELGMLRAIGLSTTQMIVFLTAELAFLFMVGIGVGTGLGVWVSNWFIPLLQVGNDIATRVPPFLITIDWPSVFQNYMLFGILFVAAMIILAISMIRMKIFQAIKLGETT